MSERIRPILSLKTALAAIVLGAFVYTYCIGPVRRRYYTAATEVSLVKICSGGSVIQVCRRRQHIQTLFVVDTQPGHAFERVVARATYANLSFADPTGWLTVFRLLGNSSEFPVGRIDEGLEDECEAFGDIVLQEVTADDSSRGIPLTFLRFIPWVLTNCPSADIVVHMAELILPEPSNLARFGKVNMNAKPEVVHCFQTGNATTACAPGAIMMMRRAGLEALANNGRELNGRIVTEKISTADIATYVEVHSDTPTKATKRVALFHVFTHLQPGVLPANMVSFWNTLARI